jgi:arylsulfatase A-like enzyme
MARRLVERGVRYVQVWSGGTTGEGDWDGHKQCDKNHVTQAAKTDQPVAALLQDLAARGLLDTTLVVWGGEFGRTPTSDGGMNGGGDPEGRDHNPYGFSIWMAGGGIKGGQVIGRTDEIGLRAIEYPVHVHDLHASMLHLLGLDHTKLTYRFQGRDYRLTDVHGKTDLAGKLRAL